MPHQEGHNELPTRHHQHGTSAVPFLIWWLLFCIFVTPLLIFLIPVLHLSSLINLPPFISLSVFFFLPKSHLCSLPHYSTMPHLSSFFFPSLSIVWLTFVWIAFSSTYSFRCFRWAGHSPLTPGRPPVLLVSTDWGPLWDGQFCRGEYNGRPTSLCYPPCMYDWIIKWIGTFLHTRSLACQNTSLKRTKIRPPHHTM